MISIKIHLSYRKVVAVCDLNLIGKRFEEGIKQLDCRQSFYKGEEYSEENAVKLMQKQSDEDATFNIVGEESVNAALKAGIISKESVAKVDNVPFALTLL